MFSVDDTIAAIATPVGEGGIGIVRISGPDALAILRRVFVRSRLHSEEAGAEDHELAFMPASHWSPRRLTYGHVVNPTDNAVIDECLAVYMPAPHTYTRQDVVEIQAHGGPVPLRRILEVCLRLGARLAGPGEFTVRAFLNGRIDLSQAEAVLDVVRARTEAGLRVAVEQLGGRLSDEARSVRRALLDVLAYLEASIDFAESDLAPRDIRPALDQAARRLDSLLAGADQGIILRQGLRVAIVGRPNVGKSSLLNALLRTNRAIVTPIPGTTRDTLEETINLGGVPFVLVDTAGMGATGDPIEQLGVERSRDALARADLSLVVVDGSEPLRDDDRQILAAVDGHPSLLVVNKIDLVAGTTPSPCHPVTLSPCHPVSALTGQGLAELEQAMVRRALGEGLAPAELPRVSHPRHKAAIGRALDAVCAAMDTHQAAFPADFVAIDLTTAVDALGEITGETASEDLLEAIFGQFCVGK